MPSKSLVGGEVGDRLDVGGPLHRVGQHRRHPPGCRAVEQRGDDRHASVPGDRKELVDMVLIGLSIGDDVVAP